MVCLATILADDNQFDMITSPITTAHFHSRVLALLSTLLSGPIPEIDGIHTSSDSFVPLQVSALSSADTALTPDESMSQIIATVSSWIDLSSPDPLIADLSSQILKLEIAYAAFCGVMNVIIPGPRSLKSNSGDEMLVRYSRAVLDALSLAPFMQIHIWLPMIAQPTRQRERMGDLAPFARDVYQDRSDHEDGDLDVFGSWAAWDIIRAICRYSSRLGLGKSNSFFVLHPPAPQGSVFNANRALSFINTKTAPAFFNPISMVLRTDQADDI